MRIFIDANILIDLIDENREYHKNAIEFIKSNINNLLFTSCDILTTLYYVTKKNKNPINNMENILNLVTIIPFSNEEALNAIRLMQENNNFKDFEDTLQYILAKKIDAHLIITNDKKFFSPDIKIVSTKDYLC